MATPPVNLQAVCDEVVRLLSGPVRLEENTRRTIAVNGTSLCLLAQDPGIQGFQVPLAEMLTFLLANTTNPLEPFLADERACRALGSVPLSYILRGFPCFENLMMEIGERLAEQVSETPPGALLSRLPASPLRDALVPIFLCALRLHKAREALLLPDNSEAVTRRHATDALAATKSLTDTLRRLASDRLPESELVVALCEEFVVFKIMLLDIFEMYVTTGTKQGHWLLAPHREAYVTRSPLKSIMRVMIREFRQHRMAPPA